MSSPIIRRHRLGSELRALRTQAQLTGAQVIERLGWASPSKLTRIERGQSRPDLADVMDMLDLYGATGADREKLIAIARDAASTRGWWRSIAGGQRAAGYAQLEAGAVHIRQYEQFLVPGILQTAAYSRVRVESVESFLPEADIDATVDVRAGRQHLLTEPESAVRYEAIVDEAFLHRSVAPADVMREQLRHLLELAARPNITLRVLPFDVPVGEFYVPHTSFSIYRFTDPDDPATIALETLTSDLQLRDEEDVDLYEAVWRMIVDASLDTDESAALVRSHAERA